MNHPERPPRNPWPALKARWRRAMVPVGRGLGRTDISPNALTALGLLLNIGAAAIIAAGWYTAGALAFLGASAFDALDGAVARATGRATAFGAFFDSLIDRYAEAAVFFGLLASLALRGELTLAIATLLGLLGSLMVSYARARAEGLGVDCEIGLLQRPERVLLLALGLLAPDLLLAPVLWLLAAITNFTVVQRALHVRRELDARDRAAAGDDHDALAQELHRLQSTNNELRELMYFATRCPQCGRDLIRTCPVCD